MRKEKRLVCTLLIVCMTFVLLFANGNTFGVRAELTDKVLLDQNFDNESVGSEAGWTDNTATPAPNIAAPSYMRSVVSSIEAGYTPALTSKAFYIRYNATGGAEQHGLFQKELSEEAEKIVLTYDVLLTKGSTSYGAILPTPLYTGAADARYDQNAAPIQLATFLEGSATTLHFSLGKGNYESLGVTLDFGKWYTIQVEVDLTKATAYEGIALSYGTQGGQLTAIELPTLQNQGNVPIWNQGATMDRLTAGYYEGQYTMLYLDNIKATGKVPDPGIRFDKTTYTINYGETLELNPTIIGGACEITYESNDINVVRAEGNVLTAVGAGVATITATPSANNMSPVRLTVVVSGGPIVKLNFDNEKAGDTPSGWVDNPATPYSAVQNEKTFHRIAQHPQNGTNALFVAHLDNTANYLKQYALGTAVDNAVLEYDVYLTAVSAGHQATILPVLLYEGTTDNATDFGNAPIGLYVQCEAGTPILLYNYGRGIERGKEKIATLAWDKSYTLRVEYDLPNKSVKVYLDDSLLTLTTNDLEAGYDSSTISSSQKLDRISTGAAGNQQTRTYLDNIEVSTKSTGLPVVLDFNQETVGQEPSGWTVNPNTSGTTPEEHYLKVEQDALDASNRIVRMYQGTALEATHSYSMRYTFAETEKAVLRYRFKIDSRSHGTYLPSLLYSGIDNNEEVKGSPLLLFMSGPHTLEYGFSDGRMSVAVEDLAWDIWHEVVMTVDLRNDTRLLFVDGNQIDLSDGWSIDPYPDKTGMRLNRVSVGFYSGMGNRNIYFDDLQILPYLNASEVSFGGTDFMVREGSSLTLAPVFRPVGAAPATLSYVSANSAVATVDENGVVTGVKKGSTTITVTAETAAIPPVTLNITVGDKMTGSFANVPANLALPVHGHTVLAPALTLDYEGDNSLELISENPNIVTTDEWNEVLAIGEGQTNVIVRSKVYPWLEQKIPVTVTNPSVMRKIYVSTNGTGDGSSPSNATTLDGAVTILAGIDKTTMSGNVEVILAEGYYYRTETLALNETHGGNHLYSVVFKAAEDAEVTIGGGMHISGSAFTLWKNGIYVTDIPEGVVTRQMYVDGVRATRAVSDGNLSNVAYLIENGENIGIICTNTELLNCTNPDGMEIINAQYWGHRRVGVSEIRDAGNGKVHLIMDQPAWQEAITGNEYSTCTIERIKYIENSLVLLNQSGEWYLDEVNNKLYYMPRAYEDLSEVTITLPLLDAWDEAGDGDNGLVSVQGTDYDNPVQNITFQGIIFADTTYMRPSSKLGHKASEGNHLFDDNEEDGYQSADAVIAMKKANGIHFMDCTFTRLGTTALKFNYAAKNSRLVGNRFYDLSGGAIVIGEYTYGGASPTINRYPSEVKYLTKNIDVYNNYIHHVGVEYQSACGIYVGFIPNIDIVHNEIYSTAYSGVYTGAGWNSPTENMLKNLNFSDNYVHDCLHMGTCDGGGIYCTSLTAGNNSITGNYFVNQGNCVAPIYFDSGSGFWNAQNNVVDVTGTRTSPNCGRPIDWAYIADTANHITLSNNYYKDVDSSDYYGLDGFSLTIENNTKVNIWSSWPAAAQQIMNHAGVEAAYEDQQQGMAKSVTSNLQNGQTITLDAATSFQVEVTGTDGRGREVDVSNAMRFVIGDKSVVAVSDTGLITGLKAGTTTVKLYVVSSQMEFALETVTVTVTDVFSAVGLEGITDSIEGYVLPGVKTALKPYGTTVKGNSVTLSQVTYEIADESIATVDENGLVSFHKNGQTTLTVTASAGGNTATKQYTVVAKPVSVAYLNAIFEEENQTNWNGSNANWNIQDGVSITAEPNGTGIYTGVKYGDEMMTFYLKLERNSAGSRILFRATEDGSGAYAIEFTAAGTALKKLSGATETSLATSAVVLDSQVHRVQLAALNEQGNVRIVLYIDGTEVLNHLAEGANALTAAGYFGFAGADNDRFTLYRSRDTAALESAIARANAIDPGNYTQENYAALEDALAAANSVMNSNPTKLSDARIVMVLMDLENTMTWLDEDVSVEQPLIPSNPPTGDNSPLMLCTVLALAAGCAMLLLIVNKKKLATQTPDKKK
ncbi:MAG: Ig-like domain-containing protein [Oscillospiraceae bacterium]|nr:Ig-like domain-containing protein [Oscillospiraceae bacterium]